MKKIIFTVLLFQIVGLSAKNIIDKKELPEFVQKELQKTAIHLSNYKNQNMVKGGGSIASIGGDANCNYNVNSTSIQDLINNASIAEIRLADTASYFEDLFISDKSISIRGGFANCMDANSNNQSNTQTLITGSGSAPVISISGSSEAHNIVLQNLGLTNGQGAEFFHGGGISTLGASASITVDNVNIFGNTGTSGGGIAINNGDTDMVILNSFIQSNTADSGGGIHCLGTDASIAILGLSGVLNNFANDEIGSDEIGGGGIYITEGCVVSVFSGSKDNPSQYGISGNTSQSNGGGVLLTNGAKLNLYGQVFCYGNNCYGDASQPVNISNNKAYDNTVFDFFGNGGGIYAYGFQSDTQVYMQGVLINNNHADQHGGGLMSNTADIELQIDNASCWDHMRCNFFQGNEAKNSEGDDSYGGALYLSGSNSIINNTFFEDNRADYGVAISLRTGITNISGSVLNNNGNSGQGGLVDNYVISLQDSPEITIEHATITDNKATTAVLGRLDFTNMTLNIYSSIIHDVNSGTLFDGNTGFMASDLDCIIAHDLVFLNTMIATNTLNENPQFVNSAQRDYHLNSILSPAVDFCVLHNTLGDIRDMDGQLRGWDDNLVANNQGNPLMVYDAGADETYDNDIIFANDFEQK